MLNGGGRRCVQCSSNFPHCPQGRNCVNFTCTGDCSRNSDCQSPSTICDLGKNECVECLENKDCNHISNDLICTKETGKCSISNQSSRCTSNADCQGPLVCDKLNGYCEECLNHDDCKQYGQLCKNRKCSFECKVDGECESSAKCLNYMCTNNTSTEKCRNDIDCIPGFKCNNEGFCYRGSSCSLDTVRLKPGEKFDIQQSKLKCLNQTY